jgi:NAD(P)H-hydrate epimerase
LVIGGSEGKLGAPIMAGLAALRSGAGWCSIAVPRGQAPVDMPIPVELTVENFFDGAIIDPERLRRFIDERRVAAVIVGPGWIRQCLDLASFTVLRDFASIGGKVILDAGALHNITALIAKQGSLPHEHFILTPHHGEWLKLGDAPTLPPLTPAGVIAANQMTQALGAHIIYKNAAPVIMSPKKSSPIICLSGTSALSRAGSGDLLAGTYLGGTGNDGINLADPLNYNYGDVCRGEVNVDPTGRPWVASVTQSANFPTVAMAV